MRIEAFLQQQIAEYILAILGQLILLVFTAVVLKRQNHRVVGSDESTVAYCQNNVLCNQHQFRFFSKSTASAYFYSLLWLVLHLDHTVLFYVNLAYTTYVSYKPWTRCQCTWPCRELWLVPCPHSCHPSSPAQYTYHMRAPFTHPL